MSTAGYAHIAETALRSKGACLIVLFPGMDADNNAQDLAELVHQELCPAHTLYASLGAAYAKQDDLVWCYCKKSDQLTMALPRILNLEERRVFCLILCSWDTLFQIDQDNQQNVLLALGHRALGLW